MSLSVKWEYFGFLVVEKLNYAYVKVLCKSCRIFSSFKLLDINLYCDTYLVPVNAIHDVTKHEGKILLFLYWISFLYFNRLVGITLNVAGNCHLMPVERVTGEDFWILCRILKNNPYINGMSP